MILTKQQEKDIKKLIELKKQLQFGKQTCSVIPGIDLEYFLETPFDEAEIIEWRFLSTDKKKNNNLNRIVIFLNNIDASDLYYIDKVKDNVLKFDKIFKTISELQEKIIISLTSSIDYNVEDIVYDLVWGNLPFDDFLKELENHEKINIENLKKEIKDLENKLEKMKDFVLSIKMN